MALHTRIDGDVVILSNIGRLMNDPRYTSSAQDLAGLLERGHRQFLVELADVHEVGPPLLGVLMTLTRRIRQGGGEVALVRPSRAMERFLVEMQMQDYWEIYPTAGAARSVLGREA